MEKVLVIGGARSGIAAAKILQERGAKVVLSDSKENLNLDLRGVEIKLGKQTPELLNGVDKIIVSPAVPIKIPLLVAATEKISR
jgi:UDP-N-acetylmuramoylalanine-D-glutamate ligase